MKLLWVPHTNYQPGLRGRYEYYIERLAPYHEIHIISWDTFSHNSLVRKLNPLTYAKSLQYWSKIVDGIVVHHLPRLPSINKLPTKEVTGINNQLFHWLVRKIIKEQQIDIVICPNAWYILGLPPFNLKVPLVIDYFDLLDDDLAKKYFINSQAVLCASSVMQDQVLKYNKQSYYFPNGIDTSLFNRADGKWVREKYSLGDSPVISLIGLTSSPSLYFINAVKIASRKIKDLKCLLVGGGSYLADMKRMVGDDPYFIFTGAIPYHQIPDFFVASNVGMYPGEKKPYYDAACPIKILEYTAAGKPVVTPELEELRRWNFPNLIFADPNPEDYAEGIFKAFHFKGEIQPSILETFEIDSLVSKLISILETTLSSWRTDLRSK
jgi:glycosyltransferase involved in cell wall biosynthesis